MTVGFPPVDLTDSGMAQVRDACLQAAIAV
jgi:hypothetical protein